MQDMKEKHEKETALKGDRDLLTKDAADREAANQVTAAAAVEASAHES